MMKKSKKNRRPMRDTWLATKWGAMGAGLAYLFDPQMGRTRRSRLAQMAGSRLRGVSQQVLQQTKHASNVAKGQLHETIGEVAGDGQSQDQVEHSDGRTQHPLATI